MTLVIMAAGLSSRYGGCKQIEGVGPGGEILLEYSVFDAVRAGFSKVVFIIKEEMRPAMDELCAAHLSRLRTPAGEAVRLVCVCQDYSSLPAFYAVPEGRTKPFGTLHAVLCARGELTERFAVINADDFYGPGAFRQMAEALQALAPEGEACAVCYRLKNTVSRNGTVTRGVCRVEGGLLQSVDETYQVIALEDGSIRDRAGGEGSHLLDPDSPVSMTLFGFTPAILPAMEDYFCAFLRALAPDDVKSECLLPVMVDALIRAGTLTVPVQQSDEKWLGMTYAQDRAGVSAALRRLHENGVYPPTLR